jgi:hypothetical protein
MDKKKEPTAWVYLAAVEKKNRLRPYHYPTKDLIDQCL